MDKFLLKAFCIPLNKIDKIYSNFAIKRQYISSLWQIIKMFSSNKFTWKHSIVVWRCVRRLGGLAPDEHSAEMVLSGGNNAWERIKCCRNSFRLLQYKRKQNLMGSSQHMDILKHDGETKYKEYLCIIHSRMPAYDHTSNMVSACI